MNEGMLLEIANALEEFAKRLATIARAHGVARATPKPPEEMGPITQPRPVPQPVGNKPGISAPRVHGPIRRSQLPPR